GSGGVNWRFKNEPPGARRTLHEFGPATLEVEFFRLACRAGDLLPTELRARYEPANWMTIDGTDPGLHPLDVSALPSDYQPGPESELPAPLCWLALLHRDLIAAYPNFWERVYPQTLTDDHNLKCNSWRLIASPWRASLRLIQILANDSAFAQSKPAPGLLAEERPAPETEAALTGFQSAREL